MGAAEVMPETPLQAVPILSRESSFSSSPRRYYFQYGKKKSSILFVHF